MRPAVLSNRSAHARAALYCTFEPELARSIARCIRLRHIPTHIRWLNIAKIALCVLFRVFLKQRAKDEATLFRGVQALVDEREAKGIMVGWRLAALNARTKIGRLRRMNSV